MPIKTAHLITVDGLTPYQTNAMHAFVSANADGWWHNMNNVWIVGGPHNAAWWRDHLMPHMAVLPGQLPPALLVVALPPEALRDWAYYGPNNANQIGWLTEQFRG